MKKNLIISTLAFIALAAGTATAQTPAPSPAQTAATNSWIKPTSVVGEVTAIDAANKQVTVGTKDGSITLSFSDKTSFKRVPPGETSMEKAETIAFADIGTGDMVYARGKVSDDKSNMPALQLVVTSKAAISQKQAHDREEWNRRGIVGRINALNAATKEITLMMRAPGGERPITIVNSDKVMYRRYAPDSVKFSDARPSSFAELKVGDQVRALGDKSEDGARFTPQEIVSGSFRMVGGAITAINPATNEITINNLQTGQPLTVVVNKDSVMRRIPPEMAAMMAQRRAQAAGGGGGSPPAATATPQAGAGGGPPRGGRGGDLDEMIERLPQFTLAELKKGDVIAVSSTTGVDPTRVTAIKLVAGIEALMTRPQGQAGGGAQSPSLNLPGLDSIGGP
jgi:hypothetical protein